MASPVAMTIDSSEITASAEQRTVSGDGDQSVAHGGAAAPQFKPLSAREMAGGQDKYRRVRIPAHRYTPLRNNWENIMRPLVEHMKVQVRFNPKTRNVEMKTSEHTDDPGALQKSADFVQAFAMGFEVQDAVALLRLDDLFVDTFEIKDVKMLHGDHLSRAIGRVAGQGGKTRFAIENATRTRIVLADQKIHILGSFQNIKIARDAICKLILGSPPGKVYNQMRSVATVTNAAGDIDQFMYNLRMPSRTTSSPRE